ncbi:MAG: phosphoglycerate kinase [bacterium]
MDTIPIKSIKTLSFKRMRVLLRADLNVPLKEKNILQDYKLQALLPTISYIQNHGGKVILATHLGRPDAQGVSNFFNENLSTKILIPWFKKHGYSIDYEVDLLKAKEKSYQHHTDILLLENLRFFNGEKETNVEFAQILADLADVYVNEAFGIIHRKDTSVIILAKQFLPQNRGIGLLMEREIRALTKLKQNPEQPFAIILGGNKISDKVKLLERFMTNPIKPQFILIGGAIALPFLHAQELCLNIVPESDSQTIALAKQILHQAQEKDIEIQLPQDLVITDQINSNEPETYPATATFSSSQHFVDIGQETIDTFRRTIDRAHTVFANGTMGIYENPKYAHGTKEILTAIANAPAYTVIGGGDAASATHLFGLEKKMDYISTGGGATLAFLAEPNPYENLPALKVLITKTPTS